MLRDGGFRKTFLTTAVQSTNSEQRMYPSFPGSLEDTQSKVREALDKAFQMPYPAPKISSGAGYGSVDATPRTYSPYSIEAIFPDSVLTCAWVDKSGNLMPRWSEGSKKYFSIPWSLDDDDIEFGEPEEVRVTMNVDPVKDESVTEDGKTLRVINLSESVMLPSVSMMLDSAASIGALRSTTRMFRKITPGAQKEQDEEKDEAMRSDSQRKAIFARLRAGKKGLVSQSSRKPSDAQRNAAKKVDPIKSMIRIMDSDQPGGGAGIIKDALATLSSGTKAKVFDQWAKLTPKDQETYLIGEYEDRNKLEKKYKALRPLGVAIDTTF